jgi:hypothetical protein
MGLSSVSAICNISIGGEDLYDDRYGTFEIYKKR